MKKLLLLLLLPIQALAGDIWYRAHDANSIVIGPVCVPELVGEEYYGALDFDTSNLVITIYASGDGIDTAFVYTGGNIDNADSTPPAWDNPTTNAIGVEADDDCIRLHLRDEVLAVTSATEWAIIISDGGVLLMDYKGQILALADSADNQADVTSALNSYDGPTNTEMIARTTTTAVYATGAGQSTTQSKVDAVQSTSTAIETDTTEIGVAGLGLTDVSLATDAVDADAIAANAIGASEIATDAIGAAQIADTATAEIWAVQCEDQSGGYTCREAMSLLLAEAMGTCVYTSSTRTWVCKDHSGKETRFTVVYGTDLDGDRDTSTPAPMTP